MDEQSALPLSANRSPGAGDPVAAIVNAVARQAWWIAVIFLLLSAGFVSLVLGWYVFKPRIHTYAQPFLLRFDGVSQGLYPDGSPFAPADITAAPILLEVYNDGNLKDFVGFNEFASSFSVVQFNERIRRLRAEFDVKLAQPRLTQTEREALEEQYAARIATIRDSNFQLVYTGRIPLSSLGGSMLADILETWADNLIRKGVFVFDVAIPDPVSSDVIARTEPFISLDILSDGIGLLDRKIKELGTFNALRAEMSADGLTLEGVDKRLADLRDYQLEPLRVGLGVRPVVDDQRTVVNYLNRRRISLEDELAMLREESKALQQTLTSVQRISPVTPEESGEQPSGRSGVVSIMPSLSSDFLDRLLALTQEDTVEDYLISLYDRNLGVTQRIISVQQRLKRIDEDLAMINEQENLVGPESPEGQEVTAQLDAVRDQLTYLTSQLRSIRDRGGEIYLRPNRIYARHGPMEIEDVGMVSTRFVMIVLIMAVIVAFALSFVCGLLRDKMKNSRYHA